MASRTSRSIEAAECARLPLRLRAQRFTYEEIAARCGHAFRSAAYTAIRRKLESIPRDAATDLRRVELESLDLAERALAEAIERGEVKAVGRMLLIKHMRARLTGPYELQDVDNYDQVKEALDAFLGETQRMCRTADEPRGEHTLPNDRT